MNMKGKTNVEIEKVIKDKLGIMRFQMHKESMNDVIKELIERYEGKMKPTKAMKDVMKLPNDTSMDFADGDDVMKMSQKEYDKMKAEDKKCSECGLVEKLYLYEGGMMCNECINQIELYKSGAVKERLNKWEDSTGSEVK